MWGFPQLKVDRDINDAVLWLVIIIIICQHDAILWLGMVKPGKWVGDVSVPTDSEHSVTNMYQQHQNYVDSRETQLRKRPQCSCQGVWWSSIDSHPSLLQSCWARSLVSNAKGGHIEFCGVGYIQPVFTWHWNSSSRKRKIRLISH